MKNRDAHLARGDDVTPSARRLVVSLRDIGYDFSGAVADVVDNSVSAGARRVEVLLEYDGPNTHLIIADDGTGMTDRDLVEAMRFGTRRAYGGEDLGRYGLGLKTASLSQARRLTVVSRRSPVRRRLAARTLDLDHVEMTDRWEVIDPPVDSVYYRSLEWLNDAPGTVVVWEHLDRVLPGGRSEGGWAKRRVAHLATRLSEHLGMVFHRFLEQDDRLVVTVNGEKVAPWNPFAPDEGDRLTLPVKAFEISAEGARGTVVFTPCVLPPRERFSSLGEFERLSGPQKWNRQQGLYVYRAGRMVQSGGWSGIRAPDEHTKLARAALDFGTELDSAFRINVSKMRVLLPQELRTALDRPIHELCRHADSVYRSDAAARKDAGNEPTQVRGRTQDLDQIAASLLAAAVSSGEQEAFTRIMSELRRIDEGLAETLGW